MKHTFLLIILFALIGLDTYSQNDQKLIGTWIGKDYWNNSSEVVFTEDQYMSLTIRGEILGGNNFKIKGTNAELKYSIDSSQNPIWIDLIVIEKETQIEKGRIKGILNFASENKMYLLLDFTGNRPQNFTKENEQDTAILEKKN